jgi:hypothetical protein
MKKQSLSRHSAGYSTSSLTVKNRNESKNSDKPFILCEESLIVFFNLSNYKKHLKRIIKLKFRTTFES